LLVLAVSVSPTRAFPVIVTVPVSGEGSPLQTQGFSLQSLQMAERLESGLRLDGSQESKVNPIIIKKTKKPNNLTRFFIKTPFLKYVNKNTIS